MVRFSQERTDVIDIPGVVSVAEGVEDGRKVIIVGVNDRSVASRVPGTVDGLPVVIEVERSPGFSQAVPPLAGEERLPSDLPQPVSLDHVTRRRPVPPGVSIGHIDVTAGTSSFFATGGGGIVGLSNSHVLALYGEASRGDPIVQPGTADGGLQETDIVGNLEGWVPVGEEAPSVDLAWYRPNTDATTEIVGIGDVQTNTRDPEVGDAVTFAGRTSGVASATVDRAHAIVELQSGERFADQFRLDSPLLAGDSGAPIVNDDGTPAGIGFASTDAHGWCNYISNVEEASGLSVISSLGDGGSGGQQIPTSWLVAGGVGLFLLASTGDDD